VIEHAFVIESTHEIQVSSLPESVRSKRTHGLARSEVLAHNENHNLSAASLPEDQSGVVLSIKTVNAEDSIDGLSGFSLNFDKLDFEANKDEFEKRFLISALKKFNGKINQTAIHANIPKKTLLRKLEKYGIRAKDYA
jgi:DNA-binding NtrC family response regulator